MLTGFLIILFGVLFFVRFFYIVSKFLVKKDVDLAIVDTPKRNYGIILPIYNEEKVISGIVSSIERINYPKDKFSIYFVIDQNTTDNSEKVSREICQTHDNFCIIEGGKGKAENIKKALSLVKEGIVGLFDADSLFNPEVFILANRYLADNDVLIGTYDYINQSRIAEKLAGILIREEPYFTDHFIARVFRAGVYYGYSAFMKKEILQKFDFKDCEKSESMPLSNWFATQKIKVKTVNCYFCSITVPETIIQAWQQRRRWSRGIFASYKQFNVRHWNKLSTLMFFEYLSQVVPVFSLVLSILILLKIPIFYFLVNVLTGLPALLVEADFSFFTKLKLLLLYPIFLYFISFSIITGYLEELFDLKFVWFKYDKKI